MAWAFQSAGTVTTTTATTVSPAVPATYSDGSLFVLIVSSQQNITTAVTGYTNLVNNSQSGSGGNLAIWYKFASASESAPTVTVSPSGLNTGVILAYSGVASFDAISSVATTAMNTAGTFNCTTNTTTTTVVNDLVLSVYGTYVSGAVATVAYATASGTTSRVNQNGTALTSNALYVGDESQTATGATTARTSVTTKASGTNLTSIQFAVAFKPSPPNNGRFLELFY